MGLSVTHILLVLAVAVLLFGRGKISALMGDVGKGIRSFKTGLAEDDEAAAPGVPSDRAGTKTAVADRSEAW